MRIVALALLLVACDRTSGEKDPSGDDSACEPVDYFTDADGDGFGDPASFWSACEVPDWGATVAGDCDDADADVHPGATDACDELDNDCDGEVDEDASWQSGYADADADGHGDAAASYETTCADGTLSATADDCDDADAGVHPGATDACDDLDNDCDGATDEDASWETVYTDGDGDGYGDLSTEAEVCARGASQVSDGTDCDDADARVHPGATDDCDGTDSDCDGSIDDEAEWVVVYEDGDGDGYGLASAPVSTCDPAVGTTSDATDCDDANADINPAATEVCDTSDNDCDGAIDEDDDSLSGRTAYTDADGDSYGDDSTAYQACGTLASGESWTGGDCDDADEDINPGEKDRCNSTDDDCDGSVDEDATFKTWFFDADGDGYGDATVTASYCTATSGYVSSGNDCDDTDADISPGDAEVCSGVDDDCDGLVDEDDPSLTDATTSYTDADGDGYGDAGTAVLSCSTTLPSGSVDNADDLDDGDADAGHVESSDGADVTLDAESEGLFGLGAFVLVGDDWTGDGLPEVLSASARGVTLDWGEGHGYVYGAVQAWDSPGGASPSARELSDEPTASGLDAVLFGDADGDGLSDLAVGAPITWEYYSWCGYCYVEANGVALYSGSATGSLSELGAVDETAAGAGVSTGFKLAAVDDQDGDDLAEILSLSATDYVLSRYSGSASAHTLQLFSPGEAIAGAGASALLASWTLPGLGDGLATIADMDGDGVQEAAISAEGVLVVLPADAASGLVTDVSTVTVTPTSGTPTGVADLGDLDGDGLSDLAFIADDWSDGADVVGAVFLLPGGSGGALDTSGLDAFVGEGSADTLGVLVASAGDLDGDGEIELVAQGAHGDDLGLWLWSGPITGGGVASDASAFYAVDGQVSALPDEPVDADGDGYDDLLFAEIGDVEYGVGYLYPGSYAGDDDASIRLFFGQ